MIVEDLSLLDTEFNGLVSSTKSRQDLFVEDRMSSIENPLPSISAYASPPHPISKNQQCEGCGGLSTKSKEPSKNND
ncbi:hypothetical protein N7455_008640 [Penicillium solitum]|uniref:uncharacterized protein n=1 Tax=Penicillium solitum TaxID=60172 RepID=UPI0032C453DD|nr:hypothetical protein N7455_008640 [Penicillium solitum]